MNIREAQAVLKTLGYNMGIYGPNKDGIDGQSGRTSRAACAMFQRGRGLAATGELTDATIAALRAVIAGKGSFVFPTVADLRVLFPRAKTESLVHFVEARWANPELAR